MSRNGKRNCTILDVARHAGVSPKTVSRVINDEPSVRRETRERVAEFVRELGYHPHSGARSMRTAPRDCVGVTLAAQPDKVRFSRDFFLWIFEKLYDVFGADGTYITFDLNPYKDGHGDYSRGLWQQRYNTCVIVGPLALTDTTIRSIHEAGAPYIALSRLDGFAECSSAAVDFEAGSYKSTRFLIERGHTKIAMLAALHGYNPGLERRRGYVRAMEEAGLELDEGLIRNVHFGSLEIANVVHRLLLNPDVTALIDCSATEDGEGIRTGARRAGRTLGKDIEVVAWTYTENATVMREAIAHVWLPVRESAHEGFELLAEWHHGKREGPIQVVYPPILYETSDEAELAKPIPLFATH